MMNYLVFVFSLLIGIGCFWISFKMISLYLKVKKWNRVNAQVISKEIIIHQKYSTSRTPYSLKVNFSYMFNDQSYIGHHVYLVEIAGGQANHLKSDAENKLNSIQPSMLIFVDPTNPTQSVMYCEGIGLYVFVFCMGILSLLIGFGSLV